jgi:acetate---CoA ligase (ADP-forming)
VEFDDSIEKVSALLNPRNVVIVGASEREGSWPATVWQTVKRYGFARPVYPINPNRSTIFGEPCYPDFQSLPERPDHLVILVPNHLVLDVLKRGAEAGARTATIYSSGFGEAGTPEGRELDRRLRDVLNETGIAITGPNCTGVISAQNKLVTMVDHRVLQIRPGPVALVGQSGGVMLYANHILADRGIQIGYLISSGNEAGLSSADHIAFLAGEPSVDVIFCYIETIKDPERFKHACALAQQAGKPVIVFKLGTSTAGREAAMTHTGKLAGSAEAFDAVTRDLGVIRVESLDDAIELIELIVHAKVPFGRRVGALTLSGAFRGILLDAAAGSELEFAPLSPATEAKLSRQLSTGSRVGNPADGGFSVLTSVEAYIACIDALCEDPGIDLVLLQAELPREPGMAANWDERFQAIENIAARHSKKVVVMSVYSRMFTDYTRKKRAELPHLAFVQEARKAVRAISNLIRWSDRASDVRRAPTPAKHAAENDRLVADLHAKAGAAAAGGTVALNEPDSKDLLRRYGIETPAEQRVDTLEQAIEAAGQIGYPVVLKAVSSALTHKSELGGVKLGIEDKDAMRRAWDEIVIRLEAETRRGTLEGMLVCKQVRGGVELVLGLHRDPEMGLVAMMGGGGILLELTQDVVFLGVPFTRDAALAALRRTQVSKLLSGYRGSPPHDPKPIADALVGLGRIATDLGGLIESIDINPFLSLPAGNRPVALDALVVLRNPEASMAAKASS